MKNLINGSILKNLLIFSWPIIISDLLQSLFSSIDAIWVGRLIGPNALAAVSASMPIMFFLVSLLIGLAVSTVIMTGQAYGMKDMKFLAKIMTNSFMTILGLCLILSVAGVIFAMPILKLMRTPDEIINEAHTFLRIIFIGMFVMFIQNWFSGILRGLGDSKTPLLFTSLQVILNIILAPLLITGAGFLPKLGIAGSALATVISGFITAITALVYLAKKNIVYNVLKWKYKPDFHIIKKMFQIGIPVSIQMIIVSFSAVLLMYIVNQFGPSVIAAYGIGIRIDQFAFFPAMSLGGSAASAFAAQAIGMNKYEKIPEIVKWVTVITMSFGVFFFIIINLFPSSIAGIFTEDKTIIRHSVEYFRIVTFGYFALGLMFAYMGVIRGSGDTLPSTFFAVINLLIIRVGASWALVEFTGFKEHGVWIAMTASVYIGLFLNFLYYKSSRWKGRVKIKPANEIGDGTAYIG